MRVLLSKALMAPDRAYIAERLAAGIDIVEPASYDVEGVLAALEGEGADVVLGGLLAEPVLERAAASGVRFFQIPWTGVDNVDFEALARHGVTVCNSHSNGAIVAEHAVALMLAAAKKLPYHDRLMREGRWNRVRPEGNEVSPFSRTVAGTRAVIVGYGAIGQGIARRLAGFECTVEAVTSRGTLAEGAPEVARVHAVASLETALAGADWVFVAVPLTEATRDLFGAAAFAAMGGQATLVNVSRGGIVEETALHEALAGNVILGAAIDTWYSYPTRDEPERAPSQKHDFAALPNVVMSPHRAGYADGGFPHLDDAIENLNRARAGEPPINVVAGERGY